MFGLSSFSPPSPGQVKLYGRTISALSVRHQSSVADLDYKKKKLYMEQSVQPDFLLNYSTGRIQTVKSGRVGKILPMWPTMNLTSWEYPTHIYPSQRVVFFHWPVSVFRKTTPLSTNSAQTHLQFPVTILSF